MKYNVNSVKEYIAAIPKERIDTIKEVIELIKHIAPKTQEEYKYNMPYYSLEGEPLFAVASQKHFMAVYITEHKIIGKYKNELGKVSLGKSCVRFKNRESINMDTLVKLMLESYEKRLQNNVPNSAK